MFRQLQDYHVDINKHIRDHKEIVEPMPFYAFIGGY
jgi:hypothetical protein